MFHDLFREVIEEVASAEQAVPSIAASADSAADKDFEQLVDREIHAFHQMHKMLLKQYPGEFVAMCGGQVVDHDAEKLALYQRVREAYPEQFVLMRRVEKVPEREFHFRSPRFSVPAA